VPAADEAFEKMLMFMRHLIAIAVLPFTVTVVIPIWIGRRNQTAFVVGDSAAYVGVQLVGVVVLAIGLLLFVASLRHFVSQGRGTLAPWDPPRALVVGGPYRYVRNPMISGVLFILFGEALVLVSRPHALWALLFLCMNLVYIPILEEPMLDQRFGDAYREYRRHVRRFLPRVRPWIPDADAG
jgi:protein-S-isoprenylcysteine O-methyltransferase Ste14